MICGFCGNVIENVPFYRRVAEIEDRIFFDCPDCSAPLSRAELVAAVHNLGEQRGNGRNYIKDDKGRFAGSRPGSGAGGSSVKTGLTKSSKNVRLDSNGIPFQYPTVELPYKEYKTVNDEIGMCWHSKYQGKELCRIVFTHKTYYFENRGIGDYNIYRVTED